MSNCSHLFKVGQKVRVKFDDETMFHKGTVVATEEDHIIVDIPEMSDHCYFDEDMLGMVYPEYNFKED